LYWKLLQSPLLHPILLPSLPSLLLFHLLLLLLLPLHLLLLLHLACLVLPYNMATRIIIFLNIEEK
jgi:hypothetical protein